MVCLKVSGIVPRRLHKHSASHAMRSMPLGIGGLMGLSNGQPRPRRKRGPLRIEYVYPTVPPSPID